MYVWNTLYKIIIISFCCNMSVWCVYLWVTSIMLSLGQYFGLIECRNVRMSMCVRVRACVYMCVCVCVCGCMGGWVYDNYFGNFSAFLLLNLYQTVHLCFICSNCLKKAACKSHLYVTTLHIHCSCFFGLSSSAICPITNSSMYDFWLVFLCTIYILLFLQIFRKLPLGAQWEFTGML